MSGTVSTSEFPRTLADLKAGWKDQGKGVEEEGQEEGHEDDGDKRLPPTTPSFYTVLRSLRRSNQSISNRLRSISHDGEFAQQVCRTILNVPLIPNERCGSWYVPPPSPSSTKPAGRAANSVYFKSTDGHYGQWSFSLRRLNLHLLDVVGEYGGCVIVDSTRRGKSMPDALAKTVPIWCAVINRVLFPEMKVFHRAFPLGSAAGMSQWEVQQIEGRLGGFEDAFKALIGDRAEELKGRLRKPMRVEWVVGHSLTLIGSAAYTYGDSEGGKQQGEFHRLILCSVSKPVRGAEMAEGGYIQGAGDDSEHWARGLTPEVFWTNKQRLLEASEAELPHLIQQLLSRKDGGESVGGLDSSLSTASASPTAVTATLIRQTTNLYIARLAPKPNNTQPATGSPDQDFDLIINCHNQPRPSQAPTAPSEKTSKKTLSLDLPIGKLGSRGLRQKLHLVKSHAESVFTLAGKCDSNDDDDGQGNHPPPPPPPRILVTCDSGKDLCVGVALALLCLFYDDDGDLLPRTRPSHLHDDNGNNNNNNNQNGGGGRSERETGSRSVNHDKQTQEENKEEENPVAVPTAVDKTLIRQRLSWITMSSSSSSSTAVNPSRSTLQAVNAYLMRRP